MSSYADHLLAWDKAQREKLGTHITCHIGKKAEEEAAAERQARHQLSLELGRSVELDETGKPRNLPLLETYCKNVYDAPLDQDLQSPMPLAERLYEIREIVSASDYPIEYRNRIADILHNFIDHARLDNCIRSQVSITIEAFQMANQRAARYRS